MSVTKLGSIPQKAVIDKLYKDLGWNAERQAGLNTRIIGNATIRTSSEARKVHQALERMLMRYVQPYLGEFTALVQGMLGEGDQLSQWERDFLQDVLRRQHEGKKLTPHMIKKVRQTAHVRGFDCGFPGFRELSKAADTLRQTQGTTTTSTAKAQRREGEKDNGTRN